MKLLLSLLALSLGTGANAQTMAGAPMPDPQMMHQADSIRGLYMSQGFILEKESPISMDSQYEFPILASLRGSTWYQIVFIGVASSRLYEVRMYDYSEKQVFYKKHQWGDIDGNVISYRYTPRFDEQHMIKVLQINKRQKKLPGYVMMFRRTHSQLELEAQAERLARKAQAANAPSATDTTAPSTLPATSKTDAPPATDSLPKKDSTKKVPMYEQILRGGR